MGTPPPRLMCPIDMGLDQHELVQIQLGYFITSLLSTMFSAVVLAVFAAAKKYRSHPVSLMLLVIYPSAGSQT